MLESSQLKIMELAYTVSETKTDNMNLRYARAWKNLKEYSINRNRQGKEEEKLRRNSAILLTEEVKPQSQNRPQKRVDVDFPELME